MPDKKVIGTMRLRIQIWAQVVLLFAVAITGLNTEGFAGSEIEVVAGGSSVIQTLILVDSELPEERLATTKELAWRLAFNGVFEVQSAEQLPETFRTNTFLQNKVDWQLLQSMDIGLVLTARWVKKGNSTNLRLQLFQNKGDTAVFDRSYGATGASLRTVFDSAMNSVYTYLLGNKGPFGELVYYQKREPKARARELVRMQLGFPVENRVTLGQRIVLKPRSSPDGSAIVFIGYANAIPEVWRLDIKSGKLQRPVKNSAPAYGAIEDANGAVYYSHARGRYSELVMSQKGKKQVLQPAKSMNLGVDISPVDGSSYAFSSDRYGNPHIFWHTKGKTSRLTRDGEYNASPKISPDGKWVAFARREGGRFSIFAISSDGKVIRRLTDDRGTDEDPEWSNDGRTVYFSSDRSGSGYIDIFTVDLWTGKINEFTTQAPGHERMPAVLRSQR